MHRLLTLLALAFVLSGCVLDDTEAAGMRTGWYLNGKTVTDEKGCVYAVTHTGYRVAESYIRVLPDRSAATCDVTVMQREAQ